MVIVQSAMLNRTIPPHPILSHQQLFHLTLSSLILFSPVSAPFACTTADPTTTLAPALAIEVAIEVAVEVALELEDA